MLGKLFKHEFKAQYKIYLGVWAVVLMFSGMACLSEYLSKHFNSPVFAIFLTITLPFAVICIFTMFIVTLIFSIYRYYTNLIKDEGYLMHTLPVKPFNLHFVKLIVPLVYFLCDILILFLSATLINCDFELSWFSYVTDILSEAPGGLISACMLLPVSILAMLSLFYACLNIGSLSVNNKGLMAFVSYMVIQTVNQILSIAVLAVAFIVSSGEILDVSETFAYTFSMILEIFFLIIYNVISGYIITKKVNLE